MAGTYGQINLNLSPSTSLSLGSSAISDIYDGKSFGLEGTSGYQFNNFAIEGTFAFMIYPEFTETYGNYYYNIVPTTYDGKISVLFSPDIIYDGVITNPFYIGPEIGISRYVFNAGSISFAEMAFLYGTKAGIRLPINRCFINLGASYLRRSGKYPNTSLSVTTGNVNFNLGIGFYL